jgi:hypothetical protein
LKDRNQAKVVRDAYEQRPFNARLTEKIFDGGNFACFCKIGDSEHLSGGAVCYTFLAL